MKNRFIKPIRLLPLSFLERETSFLGKQQLYVLVYYTVAIFVGISVTLFGISGPQKDFNLWLNTGYMLVTILLFSGYMYHRLSLSFTLCCLLISTQALTSVEMLYCAFTPDWYHMMLIVGNMVLLAVNILCSLIAYLRYTPYILCGVSIGTYIACMAITGEGRLGSFLGVFLVIFIIICILGSHLVQNMRSLDRENVSLKKDEAELFDMMGMTKEQVRAYVELARKKHDFNRVESLLNMLDKDLQRNVIANVSEYLSTWETGMLEMETLFPELSASEREVCRLILQGKQQSDICAILDKKESNISSTRTHIRRKLGMQPSDNLRKVLQERIGKKAGKL